MEYLGYCVTHKGIKPVDKKVETISNMKSLKIYKLFTGLYWVGKLLQRYVGK